MRILNIYISYILIVLNKDKVIIIDSLFKFVLYIWKYVIVLMMFFLNNYTNFVIKCMFLIISV